MRCLAVILTLCSLIVASPVLAGVPNPANRAGLDSTVRYLQNVQQPNGGFGGAGEPSQISSAWTALALAAAGINPQDQAQPGGVDAYSFLASHFQEGVEESECAPIVCTTTFERELMVVNASGTSPHDFAGADLVKGLLSRERPDGSFPHVPGGQPGVNDTIFAIFALAPIQEAAAQAPIQHAADWVEVAQQDNGGWAWKDRDAPDEVDMTGAAIQALIAAGRSGNAAVQKGIGYLHAAQNPDGGFPEFPGNPESNVASTAWAVQAIWAASENPEAWLTGSGEETKEPLDYMESLQEPDGHIRWKRSQDMNGVWMTAYTTPAFTGHEWPIPAPPRSRPPTTPPQPGQGGGSQSGSGAIAGGGGTGAPLFSRPRPQSKGKTPGGVRVIHEKPGGVRDHSRTRRGEHTVQPTGTATAEPDSENDGAGNAPGSKGSGSGGSASASSNGKVPGAASGEAGSPAARALSAQSRSDKGSEGQEVTGTLIGASAGSTREGALAFGAPGLHSAGVEAGGTPWLAIAIAGAVLLFGLAGSQLERRRGDAFA